MNRRRFVALGTCAVALFPRAARATGGLDVADPGPAISVRVLLASGSFAGPEPIDAWHFGWSGRTYRGAFANAALPGGRSALVNVVPLDAYLAGVISSEIPSGWPDAMQHAQAIVSRTYVLGRLHPERPYDVVASESDQHYSGIEGESLAGRAAVDSTAGTTLTYLGAPAHVAYSSCCGGRTADAGDVWGVSFPYLPSVPDPHCFGTPNYAWNADIPLANVAAAFGAPFAAIGTLRAARLETNTPDDRPRGIGFDGDRSSFETTPKAFRAALGAAVVRSTFVRSLDLGRPGSLAVTGSGRGHGVGLCQWGARIMAYDGASAQEILSFYFPGTALGHAQPERERGHAE
jgi:stage II sporulation protein D